MSDAEHLAYLEEVVRRAEGDLANARDTLNDFKARPSQHIYPTLDDAEGALEDLLRERAGEDCEGSYNCGLDEYMQEFIVDGTHYLAKLECEYDRHDKTYYYLDRADFSYTESVNAS